MTPIFQNESAWERFAAIAMSWRGTPYRHLQAAKGYGADCTLFVGSCLVEAGYLERLQYDDYPRDWHLHTDQEFVLESALRHFREHMSTGYVVEQLPSDTELLRGDMIAFRMPKSRATNHAGLIWDDGRLLNAHSKRGVSFLNLGDAMMRRATHVFRFCEVD